MTASGVPAALSWEGSSESTCDIWQSYASLLTYSPTRAPLTQSRQGNGSGAAQHATQKTKGVFSSKFCCGQLGVHAPHQSEQPQLGTALACSLTGAWVWIPAREGLVTAEALSQSKACTCRGQSDHG